MILASQLRPGMAVLFEGHAYRVLAADYHPGQGKMGGVAHARLQNLATGTFRDYSFRSELKLESVPLEKQTWEFLYRDGEHCWFMNPETFDQMQVASDLVGPHAAILQSGMKLPIEFVEGRPVHVIVPDVIEEKVAETAPPAHQQADSTFKPARLENGLQILVPQFIKTGDVIRLDVQTMRYMDRAREARSKNA